MNREPDPLPVISQQNYQAIRNLPGSDLPDTYDEWLQIHLKVKRERGQVGLDVREVEVDPNKFAKFCATRGGAANGKLLLDFAIENFTGDRN